jgi:transposase InsO family protein
VRTPDPKQRWPTFVRNHAKVMVACDFFVVTTATFRTLSIFVALDIGSRRVLHYNVTAHPTADWTLQQFREVLPEAHPYRFVLHDRDRIFSPEMDRQVAALGVGVLRTPVRAPQANAICERWGGSLRWECLDYLIPLSERHLRWVVKTWITHYNESRPHMSLGPGIPAPARLAPALATQRHTLAAGY